MYLALADLFKCFHDPPNSDMDYGVFNMLSGLSARVYTQEALGASFMLAWGLGGGRRGVLQI